MKRIALIGVAVAATLGALLFVLQPTPATPDPDVGQATPVLSLAGSLWDSEGDEPAMPPGTYRLAVAAVDGDSASGPEGIARLRIALDGHTISDRGYTCREPECLAKLTWTFKTSEHSPGDHSVRVTAVDRAGNATVKQLDVDVPRLARRPVSQRCWRHARRPYPYRRQRDNPACRVTLAGGIDRALSAKVSFGRAGRVLTARMRPGLHPFVDSFGHPFGYFRQLSLKRFRIYDQHRHLYGTTTGPTVAEVQGAGCMVTNAMAERYVILAIYRPDGSSGLGPRGQERDVGARGFVPRDVLPPRIFHRADASASTDNNAVIDHFRSGCGSPPPQPAVGLSSIRLAKASFSEAQMYQGAKRQCSRPESRTCGGHYADYSRPRFSRDTIALTSATTGVRNGGIIRAYVRTNRPWRVLDAIGYADPNVPCGRARAAQWVLVDANPNPAPGQNHIYGWFPRHAHGEWHRRC